MVDRKETATTVFRWRSLQQTPPFVLGTFIMSWVLLNLLFILSLPVSPQELHSRATSLVSFETPRKITKLIHFSSSRYLVIGVGKPITCLSLITRPVEILCLGEMRKVTRSYYSLYIFLGIKDRIYHPKFWYNIFSFFSFPVLEYYRNSKIFSTLLTPHSGTILQWTFFVLFGNVWKMSTSSVHCCLGKPGSIHLIGSREMVGWLAGVTLCQSTQATEGTPKLLKEHGWHDSFGNWWRYGDQVRSHMCVSAETACAGRDHWYKFPQKKPRMSPLRPEIYSVMLFSHKILQEGSSPTSSSRQGHLCNQTMLLRALTSEAMKKLRMKSEKTVHYFLSPRWKSFSLYSPWTFLVSVYAHCLLSIHSHHSALWRAWIHPVGTFLIGFVGKLLGHPWNFFFSRLNKTSFFSLSS